MWKGFSFHCPRPLQIVSHPVQKLLLDDSEPLAFAFLRHVVVVASNKVGSGAPSTTSGSTNHVALIHRRASTGRKLYQLRIRSFGERRKDDVIKNSKRR
mmetsp:Transcript_31649/g.76807  ORF Transcript_31649/g.76807 Transcript_31649/m.76807 type:complete len:99 (+) Transcript_31649:4846-5142(+)